jgi:RNA polymerase sigma-70 factor (ECF subfamily)
MMALAMPHRPGPRSAAATAADTPAVAELDRATLERARENDPRALRAFVARYERPVFALLSRMLGPGPHVEDLAQETFLRAIRVLPAFRTDGPARPSTWLLTIATRIALDARKKKRLPLAPPEAALAVPDTSTPETARARRELGQRLAAAAESLSDDQRAVLLLVEVHGFTLGEAAEAVGAPEATVKTRLFRAREQMRRALRDTQPSDAPDAWDADGEGSDGTQ